ncbi:hypothetical protein D3C87_1217300 [compost metagenome]
MLARKMILVSVKIGCARITKSRTATAISGKTVALSVRRFSVKVRMEKLVSSFGKISVPIYGMSSSHF